VTVRHGHRRVVVASVVALIAAATYVGEAGSAASADADGTASGAPGAIADDAASGGVGSMRRGPAQFAAGDAAYMTIPDPIPDGAHGELLRYQIVGGGPDAGEPTTYRIMYLSETVEGAPTIVTGLAVVDTSTQALAEGRPLLLHGHGTTGLADQCAPSRAVDAERDFYATDFLGIQHAASLGFAVVSTDYEGLGGPGTHPYLVGVSEGRSILDAGLAARQLPGIDAARTAGLVGFSQGGHAALFAAQLAPEWTPELSMLGVVLGAPATEISTPARSGAERSEVGALTVSILAGLTAVYPEARARISDVLTPAGIELLDLLSEHCFDESVPSMPSPPFVAADPTTVEPFASLLALNNTGHAAVAAPMLVFHGDDDRSVPFIHSEAMTARLCAAGQLLERRVLTGGGHVDSANATYHDGVLWLRGLADHTVTPSSTS
jgi:pimeloyl-ACP methyl ester carboxylesterase